MSRKTRRQARAAGFAETLPAPIALRKNLPAEARSLIADARNDITIPYFSGAMQYTDDTLIQRGQGKGLKIYDEIERDTHAWAVLQKRKKTLLARDWEVKPASDAPIDVDAADLVREILQALPFDRICEDLLDATLKGFSIAEVVWGRDGARIVPDRIVAHDQRRFVFDAEWRPRLLNWANAREGEALPDRKFIVHRHGVKGNNPYGLGLGTRLFWPVLFKREGVTFWLHFLEKYAGPTVIGSTPYGNASEEQTRFVQTLSQIRTSAAVAVPMGSDVKFLEASRSGTSSYLEFLEYWDKQISICVNGETLTTDIGGAGSRAASETHADVLQMLVDADADLLSSTLKGQLITWLVDYNLPGARPPDIWRTRPANEEAEAAVSKAQAEAATARTGAIRSLLSLATRLSDDGQARELLTASGLVDGLSEETITSLVQVRSELAPEPLAAPAGGGPLTLGADTADATFAVRARRAHV